MTDSEKRVLIILPTPSFFSQCSGTGGHVSHIRGIHDALLHVGIVCDFVVSENVPFPVSGDIYIVPATFRLVWHNRVVQKALTLAAQKDYLFLYIRHAFCFSIWVAILKKKLNAAITGIPFFLELNSLGRPDCWLSRWWQSLSIAASDHVLCVSERWTCLVGELYPDSKEKLHYFPNGVDLSRFANASENADIDSHNFSIGYCGAMKKKYGIEVLIEGFVLFQAKLPEARLILIGDGPVRMQLKKQYDTVENIEWLGSVEAERIPALFRRMDALVFTAPRVDSDENTSYGVMGDSVKLWEYMASSVPVVAASVPCACAQLMDNCDETDFSNLYEHGSLYVKSERAVLYYPDSPKSLACALGYIAQDRKAALIRARCARAYVEAYGSWDQRVRSMLSILGQTYGEK